jgi:acetylornithine deacetylase
VPHVRLKTWADAPMETAVFPFTTDIPLLDRWGTPLLFGPGSFLMAHTAEEYLELAELDGAIDKYVYLAQACLEDHARS